MPPEAVPLAIEVIAGARVRLEPTLRLFEAATNLAIELDHPAYDCFYLALAAAADSPLVTADERLIRKVSGSAIGDQIELVALGDAERLSRLKGA